MSATKFEIGQIVWRATWESTAAFVTCPDCGGTAVIHCTLFDGTTLTIECEGCKRGYEQATGRIQVYDRAPRAHRAVISGMEIEGTKVEYRMDGAWCVPERNLFTDEAAALALAAEMAADADRDDREKINKKEKPTKSWSWHVHYHRRAIREAERQIAYHTERLNVAKVKAKEPA